DLLQVRGPAPGDADDGDVQLLVRRGRQLRRLRLAETARRDPVTETQRGAGGGGPLEKFTTVGSLRRGHRSSTPPLGCAHPVVGTDSGNYHDWGRRLSGSRKSPRRPHFPSSRLFVAR